jgi:hypothetical protein
MTRLGHRALLPLALTALMTTGVVTATPTSAAPSQSATSVTAGCSGGPGNLELTVQPLGNNDYTVDVRARRVGEGSQWHVDLVAEGEDSEESATFRPAAEGGGWAVSAEMTVDDEYWTSFYVLANQTRGGEDKQHASCFVATNRSRGVEGIAACGRGFEVLALSRRRDGSLLVTYWLAFRRPETRWRLTMSTSDGGEDRRTVTFDATTDDEGLLVARAELDGAPADPVIGMHAVTHRGGSCWMRAEPGGLGGIEPGAAPTLKSLLPHARH